MQTGFLKKKPVVFLLVVILFYKLFFNSFTGNFLLNYVFTHFSTGSYTGKVNQFSLLYGLDIESVVIRSGKEFDEQILFSCDRLRILYNIPYLFFGKIKLTEISIKKPFIQILEKNGNWNIVKLFPTSPKEKEPEEEKSPTPEEVNLYLPVSAYLNFFIEDLSLRINKEKGENYFLTEEKNLDLKIQIATKRFRKLPLNTSILSIFETISISLNPTRDLQVLFEDNSSKINQGISSTIVFDLDSKSTPPKFHSKLKLGSENIQLIVKNKKLTSFGLNLLYELNYIPTTDILELNDLTIRFDKWEWLRAKGKIEKVISDEREFDLEVFNSNIELSPVTSIYKQIPGFPNLDLKGNIQLHPITVKGKMSSLAIQAGLKVKDLIFKQNQSTHNIPFLNLKMETLLDLHTEKKPTETNPIPLLKTAFLKTDLSYNTLLADLSAEIENEKKIQIQLNLKSLFLKNFVKTLSGKLSGVAIIDGNNLSNLNTKIDTSINSLEYYVSGSKSGLTNVNLSVLGLISLGENFSFQSANIKNLLLKAKNTDYQDSVTIAANGKLSANPNLDINLEKLNINLDLDKLIPILPLSLKEKIAPLKKTIGIKPTLSSNIHYSNTKDSMQTDGKIKLALPGIDLNDFQAEFNAKIAKDISGEITISKFIFSGLNGSLTGNINGNLIKKANKEKPPLGPYYPSIQVSLGLNSEKQTELIRGIKFDGKLGLNLELKDYSAKGKLVSENLNLVYYSGVCSENDYTTCNLIYVNQVNIAFPFAHDLKLNITKNLIEGNKVKFISTYGQNLPPNFTIHNVIGTHPYIEKELFKLIQENGKLPGFSARLDYKENVLTLDSMKIAILDGFIFGKDILFNVGNANVDEMEYAGTIQIKDIDLKQLLPAKSRKEIADGKVKADMNLSGKNLKDPIANLNLFFSVFQIGEDFGKSAIRIVSPPNLLTDGIIGSYSRINKIEVELSKGLVYADILFQRSILSTVFMGIDNNKISQERMPLANFLNRAQSEVSKYE